jgi:hypothetical protein
MNGPKKLERYITPCHKDFPVTNTVTYGLIRKLKTKQNVNINMNPRVNVMKPFTVVIYE